MKIISTVHKLLFFKTTDPLYLGHKDLKKKKKKESSYESKKKYLNIQATKILST